MRRDELEKLTESLILRASKIRRYKGESYRTEDDALHNFKEIGQYTETDDVTAWKVTAGKHFLGVRKLLENGDKCNPHTEPAIDRFADAINMLMLGYAMHVEKIESTDKNCDAFFINSTNPAVTHTTISPDDPGIHDLGNCTCGCVNKPSISFDEEGNPIG